MFEEHSSSGAVLLAPIALLKCDAKFLLQQRCALVPQTIYDMAGAAVVIVVELGARTFQKAVMVKQFQSPQKLLRTAGNEGANMGRTDIPMPLDQPDDFAVALGKLHGGSRGSTFETGKTG